MKLRSGVAFLLMICLMLFAVSFGAYRGWSEERAQVEKTYQSLERMIQARVEAAYNLLTVAGRHLPPAHEAIVWVENARDVLEGSGSLSQKAHANEELTAAAQALLGALSGLDTVQMDSRDRMYVESYLPQMLSESEKKTDQANYNAAAAAFNQQLQGSFSGFLAGLLGVKPAEEFRVP